MKSRTVPRPQESGGGVQSSGTNTPAPFAPSILLCCTVGSLQMLHVVGSLQLLLVQSSLRCGTSNEKKSDARSAATSNAKISMSGSGRPALSSSGTAMSER